MPLNLTDIPRDFPLRAEQVAKLWQATIAQRQYDDEALSIRCVNAAQVQELNRHYRQKDAATNVLTFSDLEGIPGVAVEPSHDIVICLEVARREAQERGMSESDYVALLLTHAFLHATGLDHEVSAQAAELTAAAERAILTEAGFSAASL